MVKAFIIALTSVFLLGFVVAPSLGSTAVLAQSSEERACIGTGGTYDNGECINASGDTDLQGLFLRIVELLLLVIGAVAVLMLIIGGFRYVISGGDSNAVESAKNTILYAIIGIIVAFLSWAAVNFVIQGLQGDLPSQQEQSGEES